METERIIRVTIEYRSQGKRNKAVYENASGIFRMSLPKFSGDPMMLLTASDGRECSIRFSSFCKLRLGSAEGLNEAERETAELLLDGLNYNYIIDEISVNDNEMPEIILSDATEHVLLGLPELTAEMIDGVDNGLWSSSGERLLVISVRNFPFMGEACESSLVFTDFDNDKTYDPKPSASIKQERGNVFLCSVDTKSFDAYMSPDKSKVTMRGWFVLRNKPAPGEATVSYHFPVSLMMNNARYFDPKNKYLCIDRSSKVSIDFGTSSTCAAIKTNIISMIEMSLDAEGSSAYSVYENPTNLMLYRWAEFSEKWNSIDIQPLVRRHNMGYAGYGNDAFDFGHPVRNIDIEDQRCLDAIVSQLKMIPQMLADGKIMKVRDHENSEEVELTFEGSGEAELDPIEFYGYLLGKAINHPNGNRNRYYTKYLLSYPVKFPDSIRNVIEASLTKGILRSLPSPVRTLQDERGKSLFQVKMKYSEPIACVGAACGYELVLEEDKPCLFGVFDFGGGTADYSFGMYRSADIDTEGYDEALELFGVDGDNTFGGELIISKISYWILTDPEMGNKSTVISNGIPFEKPKDELIEDGYGNLILNTTGAAANIRKLNELISRPYFEGTRSKLKFENDDTWSKNSETGRLEYSASTMVEVDDMFSAFSDEKVTLNLKIDFEVLDRKLRELFEAKCRAFSQSMDNAFALPDAVKRMEQAGAVYDKKHVRIVMAGNSSRHPLIRECLGEIFNEENICLLGENRIDSGKNRYRVTPKTAVAIGALKLEQMLVNEPEVISSIYVAAEIKSKLEILLTGDLSDTSWHRAGVINDGTLTVYSSTTPDPENRLLWKDIPLEFEDFEERMVCYIRQCGRDEIQYLAAPIGAIPDKDASEYEIFKKSLN